MVRMSWSLLNTGLCARCAQRVTLAVRAYPLLRTQRPTGRAGASPARVGRAWSARRSWSRRHHSSADDGNSDGERYQAQRPGGAATVAAAAAAPTACNSGGGGGGGSAGAVDDRGGDAGGEVRHGGADAASCGRDVSRSRLRMRRRSIMSLRRACVVAACKCGDPCRHAATMCWRAAELVHGAYGETCTNMGWRGLRGTFAFSALISVPARARS